MNKAISKAERVKPREGDPADVSFVFGCQNSKGLGDVAREDLRVCGPTFFGVSPYCSFVGNAHYRSIHQSAGLLSTLPGFTNLINFF